MIIDANLYKGAKIPSLLTIIIIIIRLAFNNPIKACCSCENLILQFKTHILNKNGFNTIIVLSSFHKNIKG